MRALRAFRNFLERDPDSPGSLGMAISEAIEAAMRGEAAKYSLGSVLNHVLLHQAIIGLEAERQMEMAGVVPDVVVGCVGGGLNFAGIALPFYRANLVNGPKTRCGCRTSCLPDTDQGRDGVRLW